jgi:hypothetical protein
MKLVLLYLGAVAVFAALPLSWWLATRVQDDPHVRLGEANRAAVDRLSAGTGFGMPAGGGDSG